MKRQARWKSDFLRKIVAFGESIFEQKKSGRLRAG
jgi:hypothetical protein